MLPRLFKVVELKPAIAEELKVARRVLDIADNWLVVRLLMTVEVSEPNTLEERF